MTLGSTELKKTREKLTPYVEEQFGVSLYRFMKQKVEVESLYNYKIANILNVDKKQVGLLIKDFGLRKINGFSNRFKHRYGANSICVFKTMIEKPENSLSDVARHFGFSREYARQVYEKIYGYPYTDTFKKKTFKRQCRSKKYVKKPKIEYLREVREKMLSLGIASRIVTEGNLYRMTSRDLTLDVRISAKPLLANHKQYFRIAYPKGTVSSSDFFICLCESQEERVHYIIPQEDMPETGICLIPQAKPHESKYSKFKEAWERLKINRNMHDNLNKSALEYLKCGFEQVFPSGEAHCR
jgi:hypothetical protein